MRNFMVTPNTGTGYEGDFLEPVPHYREEAPAPATVPSQVPRASWLIFPTLISTRPDSVSVNVIRS
ncbi:hypothetical protein K8R03_00415 [Candidatus Kaiserbacteria bacterium]|nr:hypothetical protein [Candidatus Kaiserbacteria bacterium]